MSTLVPKERVRATKKDCGFESRSGHKGKIKYNHNGKATNRNAAKTNKMNKKFRIWDTSMKRFYNKAFFLDGEGNPYRDSDPHGIDMSGKRCVYPLQNYIVTQFTGIHDRAGIEIYEGDIIHLDCTMMNNSFEKDEGEMHHEGTFEVVWNPNVAGFDLQLIKSSTETMGWTLMPEGSDDYEIVGNIFQNPEKIK